MDLSLRAPAKINLYLHIGEARPDGYHPIDSLFQMVDLCDRLSLEDRPAGTIELDLAGGFSGGLTGENLALTAARLLREASGVNLGVRIHLEKNIPIGSGLGGGSSDAAATLVGLNRLWNLNWAKEKLWPIAARLGSDVPFFLGPPAARVSGRGEQIEGVSLCETLWIVLVFPGVSVGTPWAYAALDRERSKLTNWAPKTKITGLPGESGAFFPDLLHQTNDFEALAFSHFPEIARAQASLGRLGATLARMSGSGSVVFGLFQEASQGEEAAGALREEWGSGNVWFCRSLKESPLQAFLT